MRTRARKWFRKHHISVGAFAAARINPVGIIPVSGSGLAIGGSVFYFIWSRVRNFFTGKLNEQSNQIAKWIHKRKGWAINFIIYLYTGFSPSPGDTLMLALVIGKHKWKRFIIFIILGNLSLATMLTFFGRDLLTKNQENTES
jgi:uncharacterized membrane protein YdjX (TVP38/TMEM64 family)